MKIFRKIWGGTKISQKFFWGGYENKSRYPEKSSHTPALVKNGRPLKYEISPPSKSKVVYIDKGNAQLRGHPLFTRVGV